MPKYFTIFIRDDIHESVAVVRLYHAVVVHIQSVKHPRESGLRKRHTLIHFPVIFKFALRDSSVLCKKEKKNWKNALIYYSEV